MKRIFFFALAALPLAAPGWERPQSWIEDVPAIHPWEEDSAFNAVCDSIYAHPDRALLLKVDSECRAEWLRVYEEDTMRTEASQVIQTADGGYVVTGVSEYWVFPAGMKNTPWIIKTDFAGNPLWKTTIPRDGLSWPAYVGEVEGGYVMTGEYIPSYSDTEFCTHSALPVTVVDTTGKIILDTSYTLAYDPEAFPACRIRGDFADMVKNGEFIFFCHAECPVDSVWYMTELFFSVDSTGSEPFPSEYCGYFEHSPHWSSVEKVLKTSKGQYLIVGLKGNSSDSLWLTLVEMRKGTVWTRTWGVGVEAPFTGSFAVECSRGGYVILKDSIVYGSEDIDRNCSQYLGLMKVNRKGKILWNRYYGESGHLTLPLTLPYSPKGLVETQDRGFLMALYSKASRSDWFIKFDRKGRPVWRRACQYEVKCLVPTRDGGFVMTLYPYEEPRPASNWYIE